MITNEGKYQVLSKMFLKILKQCFHYLLVSFAYLAKMFLIIQTILKKKNQGGSQHQALSKEMILSLNKIPPLWGKTKK